MIETGTWMRVTGGDLRDGKGSRDRLPPRDVEWGG